MARPPNAPHVPDAASPPLPTQLDTHLTTERSLEAKLDGLRSVATSLAEAETLLAQEQAEARAAFQLEVPNRGVVPNWGVGSGCQMWVGFGAGVAARPPQLTLTRPATERVASPPSL